MIFTRNRSFVEHDLKIANVVIERKISVRVIIEEKLSWSTHIATIKIKMARYLGIMYKIRNHLPAETRLQIYIFILVPKTIEIIWICAAHNFFIVL